MTQFPLSVPENFTTALALCTGPAPGVIDQVPIIPVDIDNETLALVRLTVWTPPR